MIIQVLWDVKPRRLVTSLHPVTIIEQLLTSFIMFLYEVKIRNFKKKYSEFMDIRSGMLCKETGFKS